MQRVFRDRPIFRSNYEEVVLISISKHSRDLILARAVAATAALESAQSSMVVGSASEPVWNIRMALFKPTEISLVPSGV